MIGLQNLSREERLNRANEVLNDSDLKQAICHQILGCTHKDVVRALHAIINEKQITEAQAIQLELKEMAPEKFDPEITFKVNKSASNVTKEFRYGTYTREQVAKLLAASNAPCEVEPKPLTTTAKQYPTITREECERLVREHYEYNDREKKKKEERELWG